MAITWTEDADSRQNLGPSNISQCNAANFASSDYTTGGYTVNPQAFGLARLRGLWLVGAMGTVANPANNGYNWVLNKYSATTSPAYKLQAFTSGGTEASASTDFSGLTLTFKAEGPY
jgi:hypothetical protein